MNIILSKFSGYCYGVKTATTMAKQSILDYEKVYSLGSIIHNKRAVRQLEEQGLKIVDNIDENYKNVLFRSHGVEKKFYDFAKKNNINIIDTTCIFVKKIHDIVEKKYNEGYKIIITGNKNHPEVIGINSFCDYTALFIEKEEDINKIYIDKGDKYVLVFQTTFNIDKFDKIVENISLKTSNIEIYNTICNATKKRQDAAIKLAKEVDMIIVIGDKLSSNSKKLYELTSKRCKSIFIEDVEELDKSSFKGVENIGVTAGASTPDFVIQEVIDYLKNVEN